MTPFEKAQRFIYRNARPLELACWQYHFEQGSSEAVLKALGAYQNPDGGFGHALEADCFCPLSSPIQTWNATEILRGIDFDNPSHPIVEGIIRYLASGAGFDSNHMQWLNTMPEFNEYPRAVWWNYGENGSAFSYNPTACLAGFALCFAPGNSQLHDRAAVIAAEAVEWLKARAPFGEQHVTACFIRLYEYLAKCGKNIVDMEEFAAVLKKQIEFNICTDTSKWGVEYVCMPSGLLSSEAALKPENEDELLAAEGEHILSSQLEDGSFAVPWQWYNDFQEFAVSANWWKSVIIIQNFMLLRQLGKI